MLQDYILYPIRPSWFTGLEMTDYPRYFRMICGLHSVCQWLFKKFINYLFSANCKGMINIRVYSENVF
jgi:hypothetical protein